MKKDHDCDNDHVNENNNDLWTIATFSSGEGQLSPFLILYLGKTKRREYPWDFSFNVSF